MEPDTNTAQTSQTQDDGFFLDSKEELDNKSSGTGAPLVRDTYIIQLAKIDLKKVPTFANNKPNYNVKTVSFNMICLPIGLKAGGVMMDEEGGHVAPFTKYIFRDINPFSVGFNKENKPSYLRSLISTLQGTNIKDRIKAPAFVLIDKDLNEVKDPTLRKKFLKEITTKDAPKEMQAEGYKGIPDIRSYEDRYIACSIEVDSKGRNKITDFSALPQSFVEPNLEEYSEQLDKFVTFYDNYVAKQQEKESTGGLEKFNEDEIVDEEVVMEDVAI